MENINLKDFLFEVDKAILWITKRTTFPVFQHMGVMRRAIELDDKHNYRAVLEKLIREAPDTYVRKWLEQQLDKESESKSIDTSDASENECPVQIKLSVNKLSVGWIEDLDRKSNNAVSQAEEIVAHREIRTFLCPVLQSMSNDAFEIAKVSTPILLGLACGGILTIPLSPFIFAAIAIYIARVGIASFCSGFENKKSEEK